MMANQRLSRMFSRKMVLGRSAAARVQESREYVYEPLMQVSFRHTYYNAEDERCPDFTVCPTPTTQNLMRSLGLIFKDDGIGFSIFYNTRLREELLNYLGRQANCWSDKTETNPVWTRLLSFALVSTNPEFVTITDIPIDTNPVNDNFYFCNRWAHRAEEPAREELTLEEPPKPTEQPPVQAVLNRDEFVEPRYQDNLLEVAPSQYPVRHLEIQETDEIQVLDISGEVVECAPRCIPRALAKEVNPSTITCKDVKQFVIDHPDEDSDSYCRDEVLLDFWKLPYGRYTIKKVPPPARGRAQWDVLYTQASPTPICFIDLLFSDLNGDRSLSSELETDLGVYPIRYLCDKQKRAIVPVHYELRFRRRSTFWKYFVVPQPQAERFENLRIRSVGDPSAFFLPARTTRLPNGQRAYRIESETEIPLEQQSQYHLQLKGQHAFGRDRVIVHHLPVAPVNQVRQVGLRLPPDLYSEIYVYI